MGVGSAAAIELVAADPHGRAADSCSGVAFRAESLAGGDFLGGDGNTASAVGQCRVIGGQLLRQRVRRTHGAHRGRRGGHRRPTCHRRCGLLDRDRRPEP